MTSASVVCEAGCSKLALWQPRGRGWGGGSGWGTHAPVADSCQCVAKTTTILLSNWPPIKINELKREEYIKKMYVSVMEYYSVIKQNEMMPFAARWMDLEIIILSDVSQRQPNIMISLFCRI